MGQQANIAPSRAPQRVLSQDHRQLNALTGIRAFAAGWVVVYHFRVQIIGLLPSTGILSPLMDSGYLGVDLFFGLSGFIIAYNYLDRLGESGKWSDRLRFLWLRLARVWPVHIFTLNVALLMAMFAKPMSITSRLPNSPGRALTLPGYLENFSLTHIWFGQNVTYNSPAWSVSAEWFAYLMFPLLAIVVAKVKSLRGAWLGAMACYATFGAAYVMYWGHAGETGQAGLRVGFEFLAGCFLFRVSERAGNGMGWRWMVPTSVAGIVVGAVTIGSSTPYGVLLAPLFGLLILGLAKGQGLFVRILSTRVVVFGGEASYALYMTHALVQGLALRLLAVDRFTDNGWVVRAAVLAAYAVMIAVAAVLTFVLVEKPARNWLRSVRVFAKPNSSEETHRENVGPAHTADPAGDG